MRSPFGRRHAWIGGVATLLALLACRPSAGQVILDLAATRTKFNAALAGHEIDGGCFGRYGMNVGDTTPSYYASIDAAISRTIMGEDLPASITAAQRDEWIAHLQSFALPDGSYSDTYGHNVLHANGQTISALGALGGRQRYPASPLYAPFDTPSEAVNYLETNIDWVNQWGESHKFWGGLVMFSQSSLATTEWKDTVFDWLDANVDPTTGWWRLGEQPSSNTNGLGGGAHIWPIYEHCGVAFPCPERVIDRILAMQAVNGSFAAMGNYLNLDALYGLKFMRSLAPSYRAAEIDTAVVKHGQWVAASLDGYLAANPNVHSLMAVVGDVGLLNQLAPTRFHDPTGAAWTDIFTDPKFYQTAAVEVFTAQQPTPVGADEPSPYASAVSSSSPVGYWRLGETAPGGIAEASGMETLQGVHAGLGAGSGPGNVAQPGPRRADGFRGMSADNRAVHFAGQYDCAVVGDTPELNLTGALTLEAWVRLDEIPIGNEGIVSKYVGSGNQRAFALYVDGQANDGTLGLIISPDGGSANAATLRDDTVLPLDTWLHVVGTFAPNERMALYINGVQVAQTTTNVPEAVFLSTADLWIGCVFSLSQTSSHFAGSIDEVAIYDRTLSADEIFAHFVAASSLPGDANGDGAVDDLDARAMAEHWLQRNATWTMGDFTGDAVVDDRDAAILAAHWNRATEGEAPGVPEPGFLALLASGCPCLWASRHFLTARRRDAKRTGQPT